MNEEEKTLETIFDNIRITIIIVSHILDGTGTWNYSMMKRIYRLFGKAKTYHRFLMVAHAYYFKQLFTFYRVKHIDALLKKKIKFSPCVYHAHKHFLRELGSPLIYFTTLDWAARCIVRYLALYHGYMYIFIEKTYYESTTDESGDGAAYAKIHSSPNYKNQVISYWFLQQRNIHNLAYYDLIIDSPIARERGYKLKDYDMVRNLGTTLEIHTVECIKIM